MTDSIDLFCARISFEEKQKKINFLPISLLPEKIQPRTKIAHIKKPQLPNYGKNLKMLLLALLENSATLQQLLMVI